MLYIHGGGPYGNGSRYRADYFMDEDVVFVTMQYRLGALGESTSLLKKILLSYENSILKLNTNYRKFKHERFRGERKSRVEGPSDGDAMDSG